LESHPREWVDRSGAAYQTGGPPFLGIPPTWVGGSFRCGLQRRRPDPSHLVVSLPPRREGERQNGNLGCALM